LNYLRGTLIDEDNNITLAMLVENFDVRGVQKNVSDNQEHHDDNNDVKSGL